VVLAAVARLPLGQLADALLPLAMVFAATGWLACWLEGCAYGPQVNAWWGVPARDEWGRLLHRLPTQLAGALATLGLFWLIEHSRKRLTVAGSASSLGLIAISTGAFLLSFARADPIPLWHNLRLEAWGWLALASVGLLAFVSTFIRKR